MLLIFLVLVNLNSLELSIFRCFFILMNNPQYIVRGSILKVV